MSCLWDGWTWIHPWKVLVSMVTGVTGDTCVGGCVSWSGDTCHLSPCLVTYPRGHVTLSTSSICHMSSNSVVTMVTENVMYYPFLDIAANGDHFCKQRLVSWCQYRSLGSNICGQYLISQVPVNSSVNTPRHCYKSSVWINIGMCIDVWSDTHGQSHRPAYGSLL